MTSTINFANARIVGVTFASIAQAFFMLGTAAFADEKLSQPIYRVAADTTAPQAGATTPNSAPADTAPAAAPASTPAGEKGVFDLTQKPGEHPLTPVLRAVKLSQVEIDRSVRDYTCTFVKRERVGGVLNESQHIFMKVMHEPFSVYMSYLKPFAGREVVYVAGQNDGKLIALEAGFKRMWGKVSLDPQGALAMRGQKRPITDVGIRNLTAKILKLGELETQFAECEVTTNAASKVAGRSATLVQVVHPVPRQNFNYHVTRLFIDNELKIPIHFDAYMWPEQEGGDPPLEESYTYTNLKINNGYTARDFDTVNNPEIFKQ